MAGNKNAYTEALRKGHNLAWNGQHAEAAAEYRRALAEFPDDVAAGCSLGSAFGRSRRLGEALAAYQAVCRKAPQDLVSLAKIAEIQARLGQRQEADAAFLALSHAYSQAGLPALALEAHRQLAALLPDYLPGRLRLADAYAAAGQAGGASQEYLTISRLTQKQGQYQAAIGYLERALVLDGRNGEALSLLQTLRGGAQDGLSAGSTPSQRAAQESQARLAETVFAEPRVSESVPAEAARRRVETLLVQALEEQSRGQVDQAIASYQRVAQAGVPRPEVQYNLGLLYLQAGRHAEAIAQLDQTVQLVDYAVGSHFALGQCYRGRGDNDVAMEHFLLAAEAVDLDTVRRDQADDIVELYKSLADSYRMRGQADKGLALVTSLANALSSKGWSDKASRVQAEIESLRTGHAPAAPLPQAQMPEWETVARKLADSEMYLQQGLYLAAVEEYYDIIGLAPNYLPVHYRLGAICVRQGRADEAAAKYLALAGLHLVRQETQQALSACRLAAEAAPQESRARFMLAQAYLKLGQRERAVEELAILGDLQLRRGDREEAAGTIRQIVALQPPDLEGYRKLLAQLEEKR
jgi:tetratricopeptide (TPR) repeat protein